MASGDGGRAVPWQLLGRALGAVLIVVAAAVLLFTVQVRDAGTRSASCGSGWDVVAGRAGWREWWAQDLADPVNSSRLTRTLDCPGAVNARIVTAGLLAVAAVLIAAMGAFVQWRSGRPARPRHGPSARLSRLGAAVTALGAVLTAAGLTGIALLAADPGASLFLYVSRTVVVLAGLLLVLPAVLLVVLGRGMSVLADQLGEREDSGTQQAEVAEVGDETH